MRGFFLLLIVVAGLTGASYAGARFTAGKLIGPEARGLGSLNTRFAFKGIASLPAKPRGWVLAYPGAREFGPQGAEIYVSPTGQLLGTWPKNLAQQLDARRAEEP